MVLQLHHLLACKNTDFRKLRLSLIAMENSQEVSQRLYFFSILMDFDSFQYFLSNRNMQRTTPRNRNATRQTAPSAMKRVGGGYVMREAPSVPIEPVRPRMTEIDVLKRKNQALSHSLEEKTMQLETALAKIRQLETEKEEELDFLFYHYEKAKSKKKAAVKKLEEVEKWLKHVLESVYLRTPGVTNMKDGLGPMQELAETPEEKVDASAPKKELVGIISCGATEASVSDSASGNQDISNEEKVESCGEEEDYWFWQEPPGWPHFAVRDGVQDESNKEKLTLRGINQEGGHHSSEIDCKVQEEEEKQADPTWRESSGRPHFAVQDVVQDEKDRFVKTPPERFHAPNQDDNAQSSEKKFKFLEEEEEKDEPNWNVPPDRSHFTVQDGTPGLYTTECLKFHEEEAKEDWSEHPEWLHVAVQDSGQDPSSAQAPQRVNKKQAKKTGFLFSLLKCLITPYKMVQKIDEDDKRQGVGYSSRSWIDLQENLMDGIITSSKRWTKQDELEKDASRYSLSMRNYQGKLTINKAK